eukprot:445871-Prymnesium_polylepis.2
MVVPPAANNLFKYRKGAQRLSDWITAGRPPRALQYVHRSCVCARARPVAPPAGRPHTPRPQLFT